MVGYFVAYRLASAGISVTLVEQGGPGSGATGNSAGNIQPASGDDDTYKIALGSESLSLWRNHLPRIKEAGKIDYLEQDVRYFYASTNPHEEQTSRQILSDLNAAKTEGVTILHKNQATGMNLTDGRVSGVTLEDGSILQCSSVVLATGAWTKKIMSEWLGYDLPVEPHGLQKVHISLDIGTPLKCAVRWNSVNIVSRKDGLVHAGSKYDPAGFNSKPSEETRDWLLAQVAEIMPGFQPSDVETIAAFAASTPSRIPLVGHLPGTDGVFLAVPSTDGFLMAAVLADITANLMIKGERHTLIHRSPLAQAIRR